MRLVEGAWTTLCNLQVHTESCPTSRAGADRPLLLPMLSQKEGAGTLGFNGEQPLLQADHQHLS